MSDASTTDKSAEAYRTIGEVAEELKLPQHVLRFWETRFPQIKPLKRAGGRRFYRPEDLALLRAVKVLLYGEGYTIKGVQRLLQEQGPKAVAAAFAVSDAPARAGRPLVGKTEPARKSSGGSDVVEAGQQDARPSPLIAGPQEGAASPAPAVPVDPDVVPRLEALALDLADCVRLLAAARVAEG